MLNCSYFLRFFDDFFAVKAPLQTTQLIWTLNEAPPPQRFLSEAPPLPSCLTEAPPSLSFLAEAPPLTCLQGGSCFSSLFVKMV